MYHNNHDQRAVTSREMIYTGLVKLIHEKDFDEITVTDLADAAGVGRATFYRHFETIEDVLWMRCDQVIEGMIDYLQTYRQNHPGEETVKIPSLVLRYYFPHVELIEVLMKVGRISIFEEAHVIRFQSFKSMFAEYYAIDFNYLDYLMVLRISNLTKLLTQWIETGKKESADELADNLSIVNGDKFALEELL